MKEVNLIQGGWESGKLEIDFGVFGDNEVEGMTDNESKSSEFISIYWEYSQSLSPCSLSESRRNVQR